MISTVQIFALFGIISFGHLNSQHMVYSEHTRDTLKSDGLPQSAMKDDFSAMRDNLFFFDTVRFGTAP